MSTIDTRVYTPDDLFVIGGDRSLELVDGKLVERSMNMWSSYVGGDLFYSLQHYCKARRLGWVLPAETPFQCFPNDPNRVRKPDVSFIQLDRCSEEDAKRRGNIRIPPDLVVEVVSPNDLVHDIDARVIDFLEVGARLVWVVHPLSRRVDVHRAVGQGSILGENDELSGEEVIVGFKARVGELFAAPGK